VYFIAAGEANSSETGTTPRKVRQQQQQRCTDESLDSDDDSDSLTGKTSCKTSALSVHIIALMRLLVQFSSISFFSQKKSRLTTA